MGGHAAARQGDTGRAQVSHVRRTQGPCDEHASGRRRIAPSGMGGCAAPQAAHVVRAQGERRILEVRKLQGDFFGGSRQGSIRRQTRLEDEGLDSPDQAGIVRHEHTCLDDVRLGGAAGFTQTCRQVLELGSCTLKRASRTVQLTSTCRRRDARLRHRLGSIQDERSATPDTRRCADAAQGTLAHQDSEMAARCSARMISAVEVAPGSWWPTERSPRYDARPFRACIGMVARIPASAAAAASSSA